MPIQPPRFRHRFATIPTSSSWASTGRKSRHERGYGRAHDLMRARVLLEEPLCRPCALVGRVSATTIADHITPKAEGGGDERTNYQGICDPCHKIKTAEEAKRGREG